MRQNGLVSLIFIVVLAVSGLVYTVISGNEPLLGLDLQGGVSVVLQPTPDQEVTEDALAQAVRNIRGRVDGLGVAEPEVSRQDETIVVALPGVDDRERIIEVIGRTAELRFRPVLATLPPGGFDLSQFEIDPEPVDDPDSDDPDSDDPESSEGEGSNDEPEGEQALRFFQSDDEPGDEETGDEEPSDPADEVTGDDDPADDDPADDPVVQVEPTSCAEPDPATGLTPAAEDEAESIVILHQCDEDNLEVLRYQLGPTTLTGEIVSDAQARLDTLEGVWSVSVELTGDGLAGFNELAGRCVSRDPTCPTNQVAITIDGRVVSAPTIQAFPFTGDVQITGSFSEGDAKDLALILRAGRLPLELERVSTDNVSPTIGRDALDAGVVAGLVGLGLVALYICAYYRLLGLVALLSLAVSASLLWTVISWLGESQGLALTLAGVTGIIVSIGVAVDSNVVFYEHLKEDVSRGRTLRSAVSGSFTTAFSTIVKADVASLIGAGILYYLTVGPVRGFAFYLGVSTVLDLVASYFFMRPLTLILTRSRALQDRSRIFGMPTVEGAGS